MLTARERSRVTVRVRLVGRPLSAVAHRTVRLRGAGVQRSAMLNNRGVARTTVRPAKAGLVRVRVNGIPRCSGRIVVEQVVTGGQLTGRPT